MLDTLDDLFLPGMRRSCQPGGKPSAVAGMAGRRRSSGVIRLSDEHDMVLQGLLLFALPDIVHQHQHQLPICHLPITWHSLAPCYLLGTSACSTWKLEA